MAKVVIEWENLPELIQALKTMPHDSLRPLMETALSEEANVIFARSQFLVPVRTGVLRGSGHVSPMQRFGAMSYLEISYGGPAASYAMWVHESFSKHTEPTQRKYLEKPVNERAPYLQRNVAMRMNDMLRKSLPK